MIAVAFGNVAQFISAGAAVVIVLGGVFLLFHGLRTDVEVTAEADQIKTNLIALDVRVKLNPVGSLRVKPYEARACAECNRTRFHPSSGGQLSSEEPWYSRQRCPLEAAAPDYETLDWRIPTFRKRGGGMSRRRSKWGCANRRLAVVEVYEVRLEATSGDAPALGPTEELVCVISNALRGQYAEPHEQLQLTHMVPLRATDPTIGWRVLFRLETPRQLWFMRRPSKDSWGWEDDDFVARPRLSLERRL